MKSCQKLKWVHKLKCEYGHDDKKVTLAENNISIKTVFLNTQTFKDDLAEYKFLCCKKSYQKKFDEKLNEWFY